MERLRMPFSDGIAEPSLEAPRNESLIMAYRPSFWTRFWRALGFRRAYLPDPWDGQEIDGMVEGYVTTETFIGLDWKDRLRMLVSGRLMVVTKTKTDVVVDRAISVSETAVQAPFDELGRRRP